MRASHFNLVPLQGLPTGTSSGMCGYSPLESSDDLFFDFQENRGDCGQAFIAKEAGFSSSQPNYLYNFSNELNQLRYSDYLSEEEIFSQDQPYKNNIHMDKDYVCTQPQEELCEPQSQFENDLPLVQTQREDLVKLPPKKSQNLALRNIKLNMGTGLLQFIEFKRRSAHRHKKMKKFEDLDSLFDWVRDNQSEFRCFEGWKKMYSDRIFGKILRKLSIAFFSGSFVKNYIALSKIKNEYKTVYKSKVSSFLEGAKFPKNFNPYAF